MLKQYRSDNRNANDPNDSGGVRGISVARRDISSNALIIRVCASVNVPVIVCEVVSSVRAIDLDIFSTTPRITPASDAIRFTFRCISVSASRS